MATYGDFMSWFGGIPGVLLGWGLKEKTPPPSPEMVRDTMEGVSVARTQLLFATAALTAIVAAPAIYAHSKRKHALKAKETRVGVALENASAQATGLLMTAIAAPAIGSAIAYIGVQKMEDAHVITRSTGNAVQGLLTVAAAGPAIAGIGQLATSAFLKGK